MSSPDFVLFPVQHPRPDYTHRGRVRIEGLEFIVEAYLVPAGPEICEHIAGTVRKGNPKQKGLFDV